jgi:hypothetical protein
MKSDVDFVGADMPLANRFTIHILAAVAEYEAHRSEGPWPKNSATQTPLVH